MVPQRNGVVGAMEPHQWEDSIVTILHTRAFPGMLAKLPTEVLEMVVKDLMLKDLKALRATSSDFDPVTAPLLFEIAHLKVNKTSFENLANIASNPELAKHVKIVEYGNCFYDAPFGDTPYSWGVECGRMWIEGLNNHCKFLSYDMVRAFYNNYKNFMVRQRIVQDDEFNMLVKIMKALGKSGRVRELRSYLWEDHRPLKVPWTHNHRSNSKLPPSTTEEVWNFKWLSDISDFLYQGNLPKTRGSCCFQQFWHNDSRFRLFLLAAQHSGLLNHSTCISGPYYIGVPAQMEYLRSQGMIGKLIIIPPLKELNKVHLILARGGPLFFYGECLKAIRVIMRNAKELQSIKLTSPNHALVANVRPVLFPQLFDANHHFGQLTELVLHDFIAFDTEFIGFLRMHTQTLRTLELADFVVRMHGVRRLYDYRDFFVLFLKTLNTEFQLNAVFFHRRMGYQPSLWTSTPPAEWGHDTLARRIERYVTRRGEFPKELTNEIHTDRRLQKTAYYSDDGRSWIYTPNAYWRKEMGNH